MGHKNEWIYTLLYIGTRKKKKEKERRYKRQKELHGLGQACNVRIVGHKRFGREASQTNDNIKRNREERYKREILIINFIY